MHSSISYQEGAHPRDHPGVQPVCALPRHDRCPASGHRIRFAGLGLPLAVCVPWAPASLPAQNTCGSATVLHAVAVLLAPPRRRVPLWEWTGFSSRCGWARGRRRVPGDGDQCCGDDSSPCVGTYPAVRWRQRTGRPGVHGFLALQSVTSPWPSRAGHGGYLCRRQRQCYTPGLAC